MEKVTCYNVVNMGHVTQWIEYQIPILIVEGSNPSLLIIHLLIFIIKFIVLLY